MWLEVLVNSVNIFFGLKKLEEIAHINTIERHVPNKLQVPSDQIIIVQNLKSGLVHYICAEQFVYLFILMPSHIKEKKKSILCHFTF